MQNAHGKAFVFGDDVNTDVILPGKYLNVTDPQELQRRLRQLDMHDNTALLFMSSGNFSGIDVAALAQELIKE